MYNVLVPNHAKIDSNASRVTSQSSSLIVNGTFAGTLGTGWTFAANGGSGSVSFATPGQASIVGDGTHVSNLYQSIPTIIGHSYTVTVTVATTSISVIAGDTIGATTLLNQTAASGTTTSFSFVADSTSTFVGFTITAAATAIVSKISVKGYT